MCSIYEATGLGTIEVTSLGNGGQNSTLGASSSAASNLRIGGTGGSENGTLSYVGSVNSSTDRLFTLNAGNNTATLANNGTGIVNFTNTGALGHAGTVDQARNFTLRGTNTGLNTFNPLISNNGTGAVAFRKLDAGTWFLANEANSYTGTTTVQGTLIVTKMANYGVASSIGNGNSSNPGFSFDGGTFVYAGAGDVTDRTVAFTSNPGTLINNGTGLLDFTTEPVSNPSSTFNASVGGNANARTFTIGGSNDITIRGNILNNYTTGAVGITKNGVGTLTLAGTNSNTGKTILNAGTLKLDYTTNSSKLSDTVNSLDLNGGTLELAGDSHTEAVFSTTLNGGTTFIKRTGVGASSTLQMGGITFSGGAIDFSAGSIATTSTGTASTLLSQRATVAGANFAMKDAGNTNIVAYDYATNGSTGYTGAAMSANINYELTANGASTLAGTTGAATNTLKIANTSAGSLVVGANTLTTGAILFAGSANYDLTTSGSGRITPGILHNYGTGGAVLNLGALGGALTQFGTGTTVLTSPAQANAGVTVNGGTVQVSNNDQIGTPSNGAGVTLNNGTLLSNGSVALNNGGPAINPRAITLGAGGGTLAATTGNSLTVTGVISGAGNDLTIGSATNTGTVTLTGTNTYTGRTVIAGGTLSVGVINNGDVAGNLGDAISAPYNIVFDGGTLAHTGASEVSNRAFTITAGKTATINTTNNLTLAGATGVATTGALTKTGNGTLTLTETSNYTGTTTVSAGTLALGHATNTLANISAVNVNGGTMSLGANSDTVGAVTLTSGSITGSTGVLTGSSYAVQSGSVSAILGGSGVALTKSTAGTVTLTGTNAYTGATTVSQGTLLINGSTSSTSLVTVNNGGTLGGTGTIGGSVTLNDGAFLSPGVSIESLATGSNSWNGGSTFVFEFSTDGSPGTAGTEWDLLAITGNLDLSGATVLNPINFDLVTMVNATTAGLLGTWDPNANALWAGFVTTTGGFTGFNANLFDFNTTGFGNTLNGSFSIAQNGNNLNLVYTVIPEPGTALLGSIGLLILLRRRR